MAANRTVVSRPSQLMVDMDDDQDFLFDLPVASPTAARDAGPQTLSPTTGLRIPSTRNPADSGYLTGYGPPSTSASTPTSQRTGSRGGSWSPHLGPAPRSSRQIAQTTPQLDDPWSVSEDVLAERLEDNPWLDALRREAGVEEAERLQDLREWRFAALAHAHQQEASVMRAVADLSSGFLDDQARAYDYLVDGGFMASEDRAQWEQLDMQVMNNYSRSRQSVVGSQINRIEQVYNDEVLAVKELSRIPLELINKAMENGMRATQAIMDEDTSPEMLPWYIDVTEKAVSSGTFKTMSASAWSHHEDDKVKAQVVRILGLAESFQMNALAQYAVTGDRSRVLQELSGVAGTTRAFLSTYKEGNDEQKRAASIVESAMADGRFHNELITPVVTLLENGVVPKISYTVPIEEGGRSVFEQVIVDFMLVGSSAAIGAGLGAGVGSVVPFVGTGIGAGVGAKTGAAVGVLLNAYRRFKEDGLSGLLPWNWF